MDFVGKVMSLLFNMLSKLIITFLPRSKRLLISWLQSPSTVILEPPKHKVSHRFHFSPSICHEVMGPGAMILVFWMLSFKSTFSLSSFTSSRGSLVPLHFLPLGWYHLHIWSCYFSPGNLDSSCDSSSPEFLMMYSTHKLNKQGDNIQSWHSPFQILSQSVVPCPVLTVASWPAYKTDES